LDCISERGYDVRYGARPLKRVLTRDILNPLSRVVLDGGVVDGETVRVRTRAEAEKFSKEHPDISFGYISSDKDSVDKNDVVIMRNNAPVEDQSDEDGTSLLHA
jgi:hypothetical protein